MVLHVLCSTMTCFLFMVAGGKNAKRSGPPPPRDKRQNFQYPMGCKDEGLLAVYTSTCDSEGSLAMT